MSRLYTLEEVKELCTKAFDDAFTHGHYDEQEVTAFNMGGNCGKYFIVYSIGL